MAIKLERGGEGLYGLAISGGTFLRLFVVPDPNLVRHISLHGKNNLLLSCKKLVLLPSYVLFLLCHVRIRIPINILIFGYNDVLC